MEDAADSKTEEVIDLTRTVKELNMLVRNQRRCLQGVYDSESWRVGHAIVKILKAVRLSGVMVRYHNIFRGRDGFWPPSRYIAWKKKHELTYADEERIKQEICYFLYQPLMSIVLVADEATEPEAQLCIESVTDQLYQNWELSVVGGSKYQSIIDQHARADKRIKGVFTSINEVIRLMSSEYVGFVELTDTVSPDALYENVKLLNQHPEADMIYSDEDEVDEHGVRMHPNFKPDWSPDLLLSTMYTGSLALYRRSILASLIGSGNGLTGLYDLALQFTEQTDAIFHIPKILYHTRTTPVKNTERAGMVTKKILETTLTRRNIAGEVLDGRFQGSFRVKWDIIGSPVVSIIIPTRDYGDVLKRCLESIWKKTRYTHYEIIIVDNQSTQARTVEYLERIRGVEGVTILEYNKPFNFSAINNFAVHHSRNEYVLLLNNDTEVIDPDWLSALLEHAQRPEVGAVGCKLIYPNGTIQHAGIVIGSGGGVAGHLHRHFPGNHAGYRGRLQLIQDVSGVTAACLLMRKSVFEEVGGFNEKDLPVVYNDVDLCLKIRKKGYRIIYTPYAELYHHESLSRGCDDTAEKYGRSLDEINYMIRSWGDVMDAGDPYYNPNFTVGSEDFSI